MNEYIWKGGGGAKRGLDVLIVIDYMYGACYLYELDLDVCAYVYI
jgi:hypothetical protein